MLQWIDICSVSAVRFTELELMDNVSSCTLVGNWNEEDCIDPTWVSAWYNNTILPDSIVKRTRRSIAVNYSNLRENISIIVRAPDGTTYMYSHQISKYCEIRFQFVCLHHRITFVKKNVVSMNNAIQIHFLAMLVACNSSCTYSTTWCISECGICYTVPCHDYQQVHIFVFT